MKNQIIVIDPVTDATETASSITVRLPGRDITITDQATIRALYDDPSARAYGEGSYTVDPGLLPSRADWSGKEIAAYVDSHEDDGPQDQDAMLGMFVSCYGRLPDEDERKTLWSHICNLA